MMISLVRPAVPVEIACRASRAIRCGTLKLRAATVSAKTKNVRSLAEFLIETFDQQLIFVIEHRPESNAADIAIGWP